MNDEELKELVTDRLNYDPTLSVESIEVSARDGIIILSGEIESRDDRKWIEVIVRQIPEVLDVENQLIVAYDGGDYSSDSQHQSL